MRNYFLLLVGAVAALTTGCSGSSSTGSGGSSTFSLSGSMTVPASFTAALKPTATEKLLASAVKDTQGLAATKCADNFYYQVYCLDYSETPTAKTGNVTCTGTTGAFTVTGLPVNSGIGCIVRRSTDGSAFSTLATLEIPSASITGKTDTITASGDVALTVSVGNDGKVTSAVASGASNLAGTTTPPSATGSKVTSGFYKIQCGSTSSAEFSLPACLCSNGSTVGSQYSGPDKNAACLADNASKITVADSAQYIELNMYTVSPNVNVQVDNGVSIPAGTQIPLISVWGASNSTTSARGSGGEQAATATTDKNGTPVTLTWSSAQATNAIAWASTNGLSVNGITLNLATSNAAVAMPAFTATAGSWMTWLRRVMQDASGFTCSWAQSVSAPYNTDANCIAEFANKVFDNGGGGSYNLPRLRVERLCDQLGCEANPNYARIYLAGMKYNYTDPWTRASQASATGSTDGISPELASRYVFEMFNPTPDGGGGFTQHEGGGGRGFSCDNSAGKNITNALCDGSSNNDWLWCGAENTTSIRFVPTATAGTFKILFDKKSLIKYAELQKWSGSTKTSVYGPDVLALCTANVTATERSFFMEAVKQ